MSFKATTLFLLTVYALLALVNSAPTPRSLNVRQYDSQNMTTSPTNTTASNFLQQDGLAAQKMNAEFATLKATDPCQVGQMACVNSSYAQCVGGQWELSPCSVADLSCYAVPRGDKPGLSLVCDTLANTLQRFVSAGLQGGITGNDTTDPNVDDGDCDDDGTGADTQAGPDGSDEDCDDSGDSTSSVAASNTPTPSSTGVISQASNAPAIAATESTTPTMSATTNTLYRRQILSSSSSSASTPVTTSAAATLTPSAALSGSLPITTSGTLTAATASSTSTNGIVMPTVAIGPNNIVTVTVVSTVTVSATACAAAGTPDAASTIVPSIGTALTLPVPTGSALTSASLSASALASSSASPSSSTSPSSSASSSAPTSLSSSITSSSAAVPSGSSPLATPTPSSTSTSAGSFGLFSFGSAAVTTSAPQNTATGTLNISELLTATV